MVQVVHPPPYGTDANPSGGADRGGECRVTQTELEGNEMNMETNRPTIGQTFASRWLVRKYDEYKNAPKRQRIKPGIPEPEDLSQAIAEAVDAYVERKVEELRSKLRTVAVGAVDGKEGYKDQVAFGSDEMLQDQTLVQVAQQCLKTSLSAIHKFPV